MAVVRRIFPAEWFPQSGVMLTWPHDRTHWAPHLAAVETVFLNIARAVCAHENLLVVCRDKAHRVYVEARLLKNGCARERLHLAIAPADDTWARDHGPITVLDDGLPHLLDFRFNGWGGKYPHAQDDAINHALNTSATFGNTPMTPVNVVLEGGSIETDGQGTLLTTRRCLLAPSRNPDLDQAAIEQRLQETLGVRRILWLEHGALDGDDTDGHIDTLARFCDERTIAHVHCDDPGDRQYPELQAMKKELEQLRDASGQPYRLLPLPMPRARYDDASQRLPATYANFLIINGAVLMPTYDDPRHDEEARRIFEHAFPGREIIGIDCLPIIQQYGSLHCLSMQLPAGVLPAVPATLT